MRLLTQGQGKHQQLASEACGGTGLSPGRTRTCFHLKLSRHACPKRTDASASNFSTSFQHSKDSSGSTAGAGHPTNLSVYSLLLLHCFNDAMITSEADILKALGANYKYAVTCEESSRNAIPPGLHNTCVLIQFII